MKNFFAQVEHFETELKSAVASQDWDRVLELDMACRELVALIDVKQASQSHLQKLQQLLQFYQLLLDECKGHKDVLTSDLIGAGRADKGLRCYRQFQ